MSRPVKIALTVSVVVNMLLAGMVLGDLSSRLVVPPPPQGFDVQAQLAKLPPDKRVLYDNIMGPAKKQMDSEHAQIDEAKKEALKILKAEPFDATAYMNLIQHINELRVQNKLHVSEAVVELAKQLNAEERGIVAEIFSHPPFTMPPGAMKP